MLAAPPAALAAPIQRSATAAPRLQWLAALRPAAGAAAMSAMLNIATAAHPPAIAAGRPAAATKPTLAAASAAERAAAQAAMLAAASAAAATPRTAIQLKAALTWWLPSEPNS